MVWVFLFLLILIAVAVVFGKNAAQNFLGVVVGLIISVVLLMVLGYAIFA